MTTKTIKTVYENGEKVGSWIVTSPKNGEQIETHNAKTAQELLNTGLFEVVTIKEHLERLNERKNNEL